MKYLLTSFLMLIMASAQASYYQENCSNADASARWAQGHNESGAFLRGTDNQGLKFTEEFKVNELVITLKKKKILGNKFEGSRDWSSEQSWYSAFVTITPTPEVAERFKKVSPEGKIEDHVMCFEIIGG